MVIASGWVVLPEEDETIIMLAEDVKNLIPENSSRDYREEIVEKLKPGMALYEIWTKKTVGGKEVKLGVLRVQLGAAASQMADRIRFRHPVDAHSKAKK